MLSMIRWSFFNSKGVNSSGQHNDYKVYAYNNNLKLHTAKTLRTSMRNRQIHSYSGEILSLNL